MLLHVDLPDDNDALAFCARQCWATRACQGFTIVNNIVETDADRCFLVRNTSERVGTVLKSRSYTFVKPVSPKCHLDCGSGDGRAFELNGEARPVAASGGKEESCPYP